MSRPGTRTGTGTSAGTVLRAEALGKDAPSAAGPRPILRDVTMDLAAGEIVALRGPSGAGKTTLLRILGGLDAAFSGTLARTPGLRLGMVFQEPRLLPWRTLRQNWALVRPRTDPAPLAGALGLGTVLDAYPGEISLGMARRAAVVRALSVRPGLLLLDEPFASLDADAADAVRTLIRARWQTDGFAAVLVTHDAADATAFGARTITLAGTPGTLA